MVTRHLLKNHRLAAAAVTASFFFLFNAEAAGNWALAENGKAESVIALGRGASPPEEHAAEELAYFLNRITGAKISVRSGPQSGKYTIWLGRPEINPRARGVLAGRVEELCDDGFILKADSEGLIITAKNPVGVLYGAYAFLEEHAGMRWFFPGEEGTFYPREPNLAAAEMDETHNPAFKKRTLAYGGSAVTAKTVDSWDWIARNRMTHSMSKHVYRLHRDHFEKRGFGTNMGGHVLMRFVPDELLDEHPEYFALIDGERVPQVIDGRHRSQPCTTHPDVIERISRGVLEMLREEPEGGKYRFLNNDTGGWCQCENCLAISPAEERNRSGGSVSTRFWTLKNEVARRVWQEMPEAEFEGYAYQAYRLPPTGVVPDPRFTVMLCDHGRCFRHSLDDPACRPNQFFREMYEGWAGFDNSLDNYSYYGDGMGGPWTANRPLERVVAGDLRYMHRLGFDNWQVKAAPPDGRYEHYARIGRDPETGAYAWRTRMHMFYIQAKLAWDPSLDEEELLRDMNEKFYGPAGEAMHGFRTEKLRLWEETPGHFVYGSSWTLLGKSMLAPGAVETLEGYLDRAEAMAAGNEEYLRKIADDRMTFERTWLAAYREYRARPQEAVQAGRISEPVRIDGALDERDWMEAERITGFVARGSDGEQAEMQTYVRLLYDDENLYIGLEMEEPETGSLRINARTRDDSSIWNDDTVELMIDPEGEGLRYVHFAINPAGVFRDSERDISMPTGGDPGYRADADVAARIEENRWVAEMRVSAESLGGEITPGGSWLMNVVRVRRAGEGGVSSWFDGQVHNVDSFRRVAFGRSVLRNGNLSDLAPATESNREHGVAGDMWLRHWGVRSSESEIIQGHVNRLRLKGGTIYSWMQIPTDGAGEPRPLHGEIRASGEGALNIRLSTKVIPPDSGLRFSHDERTRFGPFELGEEPASYKFSYTLEPHEVGYLYISTGGEALIEHMSAVLD